MTLKVIFVRKELLKNTKGPSINDVTPRGEGGGYPQKVTWGDRGRDPVFSRGDVTPNLPFLRE